MTDLFTSLAQEQTTTEIVRPRPPARFEEESLNPSEEAGDRPQLQQIEATDHANVIPEPGESLDSDKPPNDFTTPGSETIRATVTVPGDYLTAGDFQAFDTPDQPQVSTREMPRHELPAAMDREQKAAPAIHLPTPAAREEIAEITANGTVSPIVDETIAARPLPGTTAEELATIRPDRTEASSLDETHLEMERDEAPPGVVEANPVPVRPAAMAEEFITSLSTPDPVDQASAEQAPTIEIHIGRIELRRAAPQTRHVSPVRPRFEPPVSLSAYLERRNGGEE